MEYPMPFAPSFLMLGAQLLIPVSDTVPTFDVSISCRAASQAQIADAQSFDGCMKDENTARTKLVQSWTTYPAANRAQCTSEASMGGPPSYVDLLVCLEISRDVKEGEGAKLRGARKKK
jgi:hypothetical protein